jgi:hypothetical protein
LTSADQDGKRSPVPNRGLATSEREALVALADAIQARVMDGTATLEDFGALARAREALARCTVEGDGDQRGA